MKVLTDKFGIVKETQARWACSHLIEIYNSQVLETFVRSGCGVEHVVLLNAERGLALQSGVNPQTSQAVFAGRGNKEIQCDTVRKKYHDGLIKELRHNCTTFFLIAFDFKLMNCPNETTKHFLVIL